MADAVDITEERLDAERLGVARHASRAVNRLGSKVCIDCGEPIPTARQKAAPFARRCIDCQQQHESDMNG